MLDLVLEYVGDSQGLGISVEDGLVVLSQVIDKKEFKFTQGSLAEVLRRFDSDGKPFLQLNFSSGNRVLLTDSLVGFKPTEIPGLDMSRLPRVVTTPDLKIVFEAVEEALGNEGVLDHEVEVLKKVYLSILSGAEEAGFRLDLERVWMNRLIASRFRASA